MGEKPPSVKAVTKHLDSADPDRVDAVSSQLPLPEQPPTAPKWESNSASNSLDARNLNVGSGGVEGDIAGHSGDEGGFGRGVGSSTGMREPASMGSGVREEGGVDMGSLGRQGKDGLEGLPEDAKARK